jgi:spore maturation protein CgeB
LKILIVGSCKYKIYEKAIGNGLKNLDNKVEYFCWKNFFDNSFFSKLQNKFLVGTILEKINKSLINKIKEIKPDLVFIYRGTHIYPKTIKKIKQYGCKVFGYNNDDPFSNKYRLIDFRLWSLYKKSILYYDWIFSYRKKNIDDYKNLGYNNISLLRSYYIKEDNYYISNIKKFFDIIFIGHWENDKRDEVIKYLIDNNINIKLFGTEWEKSKYYDFFIEKMGKIFPIYEKDYNLTINKAKVALVFLSKLNNDSYTRRCFEIPATKTMMLSEYTDDLANNLFEENKEVVYFRNKEELLEKIKFYLQDENLIKEIGQNGYKRLIKDGHEVTNRCKKILKVYNEYFD